MPFIGRPGVTWIWWVGLLVAAQIADLGTTVASLSFGGIETNPVVVGIISSGGIQAYALIKLLSVLVVVGIVYLADELRRWLPSRLSQRVLHTLLGALQIAVAAQLFAALANLVVLGGLLGS